MENVINTLHLSGKVIGTPVVGHEAFGEKFYYLTLGVPRLSGAMDHLPITLSERLLDGAMLKDGDSLAIEGQVRSYNKIIEGAGRLLITAFAQRIVEPDERENPNQIQLTSSALQCPFRFYTRPYEPFFDFLHLFLRWKTKEAVHDQYCNNHRHSKSKYHHPIFN